MTLLEALVSLVILGLAAVGFLELFQRTAVTAADTADWRRVVATAEVAMERAVLGQPVGEDVAGLRRRVEVRPWAPGVREVVVTVELPPPAGGRFALHRLVSP